MSDDDLAGKFRRPLTALCVSVGLAGCHHAPPGTGQSTRDAQRSASDELVDVCVSERHSCARAADGRVACWGEGERSFSETPPQFDGPRVLEGLPKAKALRFALSRACILTTDGAVLCQGYGTTRVEKIAFPGRATDFVVHAAGSCAILEDARLVCTQGETSLLVDAGAGATGFALAPPDSQRVCVLRGSAAPVCLDGALVHPPPIGAKGPFAGPRIYGVEVADDFQGAVELRLDSSLCGRFADGRVACREGTLSTAWAGALATKLLGSGCLLGRDGQVHCAWDADWHLLIPADATELAVSDDHQCALCSGRAKCWGHASYGQLGDETGYLHHVPERVGGIGDAFTVAAGATFGCAARARGKLTCWGNVPPYGSSPAHFSPVDIATPEPISGMFADAAGLCAKGLATWRCLEGGDRWTTVPMPPLQRHGAFVATGVPMRSVAPDGACGVDGKGRLVCAEDCGVCSVSDAQAMLTPIEDGAPFAEASSMTQTPGGHPTVCARTEARAVRCFSADAMAYRGKTHFEPVDAPSIAALTDVVQLAAAHDHESASLTCALTANGAVHCWGNGQFGQLGVPSIAYRASAAQVPGLPRVAEIAVGGAFACARTTGGKVYCWGSNRHGEVPDGAPGERDEPVVVRWP